MSKEDFKKMDRKEKADYINNNLSQGMSFKDIYDATMQNSELAKSKEALLNQFRKAGYSINRPYSDNEPVNVPITKSNENTISSSTKDDNNELGKLLQASDDILQMLAWWKINHGNSVAIDDRLNIQIPQEGEDVRKYLRINIQVWDEWKAFCSIHSNFSEKDLLAKALLFYMKKEHL